VLRQLYRFRGGHVDDDVELTAFPAAAGLVVEAAGVRQDAGHRETGLLDDLTGDRGVESLAWFGLAAGQFPDAAHEVAVRALEQENRAVPVDDAADDQAAG
jgi:hypothetical protein